MVTFGKAIGGGFGHLLSGAVLLDGGAQFQEASRTAFQSHTYAGASARALSNGAALLDSLETWRPSIRAIGDAIDPIVAQLNEDAGGSILTHGQGCLWGGLFTHSDPAARTAANLIFKQKCADARVLPYFVPVGGFMLTPRYDDNPEELGAAVQEMAQAALETAREMGWAKDALLPLANPPSPLASATPSPDPQAMEMVLAKTPGYIEKLASTLSADEVAQLVEASKKAAPSEEACVEA